MLKTFRTSARNLLLRSSTKLSEDHKLKKLVMCKKCYSFYYKHHWRFEKPVSLSELTEDEVLVRFTECTACMEQENAFFETDQALAFG